MPVLFVIKWAYPLPIKQVKDAKQMVGRFQGLDEESVIKSREKYGDNSLKKSKSKGIIKRFFENLSDPIIKILLAALTLEVVFTLGNCNLVEIFGIVAAIMIATVVSTVSEYGSEKAFERMELSASNKAKVFRSGVLREIPFSEIVIGDIVYLSAGDRVCADMTMLEGRVQVDQSALNGESLEVEKLPADEEGWDLLSKAKVFSGSIVTSGKGVARVERIGEGSYFGMIARDVQAQTRISPLKLRLSKLAKQISIIGYVIAIIVGLVYLFNSFVVSNDFDPTRIKAALCDRQYLLSTLIRTLTMMITVIVVAVPEGLPMMITVVLSANTRRMMRDGVLVKKLIGIETAGSLNILFTDKTGTLTTGRLGIDRIITGDCTVGNLQALKEQGAVYRAMLITAGYNTECELSNGKINGGNFTDRAISEFFANEEFPKLEVVSKTPFSSEIKYSDVCIKNDKTYVKGAAETILAKCKNYLRKDGMVCPSEFESVKKAYFEAVERGERVICVATSGDGGLVFVGLIVLKDKLRTEVKEAVRTAIRAGVQVVMLTGDNKKTAAAIAEECGFYRRDARHVIITSDELNRMSDAEVKSMLPNLRVVARALPSDKTRLVRLSQELELVVGMTGDGINDAPSLKLADVGFSMGSGTEIAKEAGDIVIADNSFLSITKTILYGRTIFKSIRKFITFQLIMNLAACGITLIGQLLGIESPITIIQMLWVNIIMDTLGGLAFAGEAPLEYYMKEKPKRRDEPIIDKATLSHIVLNGAFTLALLVCFLRLDFFDVIYNDGKGKLLGAFYALFIFSGLFNFLSARSERIRILSNIGKNKPFVFILLFIAAIQIVIIYFGGELFRSVPLSIKELFLIIETAFSVLIFDIIRRLFVKFK